MLVTAKPATITPHTVPALRHRFKLCTAGLKSVPAHKYSVTLVQSTVLREMLDITTEI